MHIWLLGLGSLTSEAALPSPYLKYIFLYVLPSCPATLSSMTLFRVSSGIYDMQLFFKHAIVPYPICCSQVHKVGTGAVTVCNVS